jgi:hypothetical protein
MDGKGKRLQKNKKRPKKKKHLTLEGFFIPSNFSTEWSSRLRISYIPWVMEGRHGRERGWAYSIASWAASRVRRADEWIKGNATRRWCLVRTLPRQSLFEQHTRHVGKLCPNGYSMVWKELCCGPSLVLSRTAAHETEAYMGRRVWSSVRGRLGLEMLFFHDEAKAIIWEMLSGLSAFPVPTNHILIPPSVSPTERKFLFI